MEHENIEKNMLDIQKLFPGQLTISPQQLAKLRNKSIQTLARERKDGIGVPYKESKGTIEYPIRGVAEWLHCTVMTV